MRLAFVVLFDALDCGDLPMQRDIENVSALVRKETDAVSRPHFDAGDQEMIDECFVFEQLPLPLVHRASLEC